MALSLSDVKNYAQQNNNSPFTTELVVSVCWAESSFDPSATAPAPSSSAGLMMVNHPAIDTVNANTPAGIHFEYSDMSDPGKAIACGTWYFKIINDHAGNGDKRETLRLYRGAPDGDYTYADKIITCESCLQSLVIVDLQTCLNQIHT
jgi:hypothetical protein